MAALLGSNASLTVLHDERYAPGAGIRGFGDALWWACSAVTTTGYGDVTRSSRGAGWSGRGRCPWAWR